MSHDCPARHPQHPELVCLLPASAAGHPEHLSVRYVPGQSRPEQLHWREPGYLTRRAARDQAREAKQTIDTHAATVRARITDERKRH